MEIVSDLVRQPITALITVYLQIRLSGKHVYYVLSAIRKAVEPRERLLYHS